jgi:hypothetical protein
MSPDQPASPRRPWRPALLLVFGVVAVVTALQTSLDAQRTVRWHATGADAPSGPPATATLRPVHAVPAPAEASSAEATGGDSVAGTTSSALAARPCSDENGPG